jgi:uncharacterized protein
VPLSDRDYMRRSPAPERYRQSAGFNLDPVWTLIALNLVFFVATSIRPDLRFTLGFSPVLFLERPWTILSAMFIHFDFWHIFGNMLTLFFFGRVLNQIVGQNKFLLVYFIGGIAGNILFFLLDLSLNISVIGASGAVFAVAGALAVMIPKLQVRVYFIIPMPLWMVVIIFFGIYSVPGLFSGVAWEAHLGGLATGLVFGYIFKKSGRYHYR